jgi:hypothetical protein
VASVVAVMTALGCKDAQTTLCTLAAKASIVRSQGPIWFQLAKLWLTYSGARFRGRRRVLVLAGGSIVAPVADRAAFDLVQP